MSSVRRPKWHPLPPPSPRILHLPRRTRRSKTAKLTVPAPKPVSVNNPDSRGKLETLFDQERLFSRSLPIVLYNSSDSEPSNQVEKLDGNSRNSADFEDEKWRFQAEFLRAECKFLRMEREIALKKLERNRLQTEKTLQSAGEALVSVRKKIYEGKGLGFLLDEEIEELEEKLEELQRASEVRDFQRQKCGNFDRQASVLRRRLEKIEGISQEKKCVREIRQMAEASLRIESCCKSFVTDREIRFADVEMLRRKMEGLSQGMLERMEEYGSSMLSSSSSTASSASTSWRIEFPEPAKRQQEACSGRCKAIVRKLVEDIRAETEQWSEMQGMLGRVREEMEELQASRDFWESRALESDDKLQTLLIAIQEWKHKAISSEKKVSELQKQTSELQMELKRLRPEPLGRSSPKAPQDIENAETMQMSLDAQKEREKRVLICRLKENSQSSKGNEDEIEKRRVRPFGALPKRLPLQEIGNSSSQLFRQNRAVFPLRLPEPPMSDNL